MAHSLLNTIVQSKLPHQATPFADINPELFQSAVEQTIAETKTEIEKIRNNSEPPTFENTIEAMEFCNIDLDRLATVFFNLMHASTSDVIDQAAAPISQAFAMFSSDVLLDQKLFERVKAVYQQKDSLGLNKEQMKLLTDAYEDFERNGANLSPDKKNELRKIDQELAALNPEYSNNLLKAINAFQLHIENESDLEGLPESSLAPAKEEAEKRQLSGWVFTLQAPSYVPFMKFAKNRSLREKMWMAYNQKALFGENSNRELCQKIAKLRFQRANTLGYKTHSHFVLEKRMAKNPDRVFQFLEELKAPSFNAAKKELDELKEFIKNERGDDIEIKPWDFTFYSELYKKHLFDLDEEEVRPYFPLEAAKNGIFIHGEKLYGLKFEKKDIPTYHEDVEVFEVSRDGDYVGLLYLDFFPRDNKRAGAWMTNYRDQGHDSKQMNRPHVSIVCNFTKPTKDKPSLLTYDEVLTLFHEFGHSLHSLLSNCHYKSLGGTHVLWDFVELPSQIMENWIYEKESLDLFASHYKTGEKIPADLVKKLKDSANFQAGYFSLRQVSFGYIDMGWHVDIEGKDLDPIKVEEEATKDLQLIPRIPDTNMSVGFSHIFAGGYSAGYYSYKWAEVLDADAFELFKEKGIFDKTTADKFYKEILSRGGVDDPMELYKNFRGREPDPKALLRRSGLL